MLPHLHQTGQSPYRQTRQEKCPFARLKNGGGRGGGGGIRVSEISKDTDLYSTFGGGRQLTRSYEFLVVLDFLEKLIVIFLMCFFQQLPHTVTRRAPLRSPLSDSLVFRHCSCG